MPVCLSQGRVICGRVGAGLRGEKAWAKAKAIFGATSSILLFRYRFKLFLLPLPAKDLRDNGAALGHISLDKRVA